jgi:hypothetical protein
MGCNPIFEQALGTGNAVVLITCTGTALAVSLAIFMSAVCTGPQVNPLRKGRHSATGWLFDPICCGSETVNCDEMILNPGEPVSTNTFGMVWHVEVFGTQIVTLTNASFTSFPVGPLLTESGATFDPEVVIRFDFDPPLPPQPVPSAQQIHKTATYP